MYQSHSLHKPTDTRAFTSSRPFIRWSHIRLSRYQAVCLSYEPPPHERPVMQWLFCRQLPMENPTLTITPSYWKFVRHRDTFIDRRKGGKGGIFKTTFTQISCTVNRLVWNVGTKISLVNMWLDEQGTVAHKRTHKTISLQKYSENTLIKSALVLKLENISRQLQHTFPWRSISSTQVL